MGSSPFTRTKACLADGQALSFRDEGTPLRLIPRRFAAAPRGTGERIPPLRFAHPLLSAFDLRIYGWRVSVYK